MCCIFTWLAWCFDASHRLVVFFMACLISSSFCCLLLTASLAGVAMGYNYSLAEYIDLKETNISVYIKRGVYDDEISDDFDWRRSGKDSDISYKDAGGLRSGGQPKAEGRRSESSIFESEGENKYEGSLMRLTSSPNPLPMQRFQPEPPYTTPRTTTNVVDGLLAVADSLPGGSMERLKAIQAAAKYHEAKRVELVTAKFPEDASARVKAIEENAQIHDARRMDASSTTDKYDKYFKQLARYPGFPGSDVAARRFDDVRQKDMGQTPSYKFRDAVFGGQLAGWPTRPATKTSTANFFEYEVNVDPSAPSAAKPLQPGPRTWDSARRSFEDSQKGDYDDSGLPSRKKRSYDKTTFKNKLLNDMKIFINKLDILTNQIDKPLDEELISNDSVGNDKSQEKLDHNTNVKSFKEATETKSDIDNVKAKSTHRALREANNITSVKVIEDATEINNVTSVKVVEDATEINNVTSVKVVEEATQMNNVTSVKVVEEATQMNNVTSVKVVEEATQMNNVTSVKVVEEATQMNNVTSVKVVEEATQMNNVTSVKGIEDATEINNVTSVKVVEETTETSDIDNVKHKDIHRAYDTENRNVVFKEFIRKYLEHLTSFGDMERKDHNNLRKRRKSSGYEYKIRGNKQTKSFWWRIVNGAQKQWSRVIMYEDKLISQISDMTAVLKEQLQGKIIT